MKPLSRPGQIKLWFLANEWVHGPLGIGLGIGLLVLLLIGLNLTMKQSGPSVETQAVIISLGNRATDTGNMPRAVIRFADGATGTVYLLRSHHCRIGDPVTVRTTPGVGHRIVHAACQA